MKKQILLTAMALVIAAPCFAQVSSDTNVMKTETAVEKAARAQGFMSGRGSAPAQPQVIENSSVMMMAPEAPAEAEAAPAPAAWAPAPAPASSSGNRPSLIKNDLPPGLVMNGPGTEAFKKKHRKKKKKAAVEQVAPAVPAVAAEPVKEDVVAEPAPAPVDVPELVPSPAPAPALPTPAPMEEPPAMPDANAMPPVESAPEPVTPLATPPVDSLGIPEPGLEGAPVKPDAPLDPFAAPDH